MTDRDLLALFAGWRQDIDSEPFAHADEQAAAIAAYVPATPGQGAGCPLVLAAVVPVLAAVYVVVHLVLWAVMAR